MDHMETGKQESENNNITQQIYQKLENIQDEMKNIHKEIDKIGKIMEENKRKRINSKERRRKRTQNRRMNNVCKNCGLEGHFMSECLIPRRKEKLISNGKSLVNMLLGDIIEK